MNPCGPAGKNVFIIYCLGLFRGVILFRSVWTKSLKKVKTIHSEVGVGFQFVSDQHQAAEVYFDLFRLELGVANGLIKSYTERWQCALFW